MNSSAESNNDNNESKNINITKEEKSEYNLSLDEIETDLYVIIDPGKMSFFN